MEEADALASRAGIMAKRMLALGTVPHLRHKYSDSYTIHLISRTAPHTPIAEMSRLRNWVLSNVSGAVLEKKSLHGQPKFSFFADNAPEATLSVASASAPSDSTFDDVIGLG
jgi:ATP-binding cassette subfamily A (ABC1) protein 3